MRRLFFLCANSNNSNTMPELSQLPEELLSKIVNCDAPPPNANKALRAAWQGKCCNALKLKVAALKRAIYDADYHSHTIVHLWRGNEDRVVARRDGHPHVKIAMSNTKARSRCLAASIAFAHYKRMWKRPTNAYTGQPAEYFLFQLGSGWYLSVSPDAAVREMEEILHILRLATSCKRTPEIGPSVMGKITDSNHWIGAHTVDERLGQIYKAQLNYSTDTYSTKI